MKWGFQALGALLKCCRKLQVSSESRMLCIGVASDDDTARVMIGLTTLPKDLEKKRSL